jgi:hypothetical protein
MAEEVKQVGDLPSYTELKERGVKNISPPLSLAPCVKDRATGRLYIWHPDFATRSEIFSCCDESGNEDPAAWMGRGPSEFTQFRDGPAPATARRAREKRPVTAAPQMSPHPVFSDNVVGRRQEFPPPGAPRFPPPGTVPPDA